MRNKPSLAEALKSHDRAAAATAVADRPQGRHAKTTLPPSRAGKKALIGCFDPDVSKQLKQWGDAGALGLGVTEYARRGRAAEEVGLVVRWLARVLREPDLLKGAADDASS